MKISHKARRGRRRHPRPHRDHHSKRAIRDPISRAMKRITLQRRREILERADRDTWNEEWAA
jgi:hypothetical protein